MTSPGPPAPEPPGPEAAAARGPVSHRAGRGAGRPRRSGDGSAAETVRRLLPPLAAVSAVAVVIVLLLFLNSRSTPAGSGPAVAAPTTSTGASAPPPSASASPTPSASASTTTGRVSPPPVNQPPATTGPVVAKVPVTVLNNSRRAGLGAQVAAEVHARGWPIAKVGNFRGRIAVTTVYYAAGQLPQARELAREFPQIQRVSPRFPGLPGSGLTLVVTRDWS